MKTLLVPMRLGPCFGSFALLFGLLSGCGSDPKDGGSTNNLGSGAYGNEGGSGGSGNAGATGGGAGAPPVTCTPTVEVAADSRALVITDPEILAKFSLERVLQQMIDEADPASTLTPLALLQRLFDTENTAAGGAYADVLHCDQFGLAFINAPPTHCPRAEGALAANPNLLTAGDPDSFIPIAIVNRLDLARVSGISCGEYRIVYAKSSGKTNPDDRVFIIFEAFLANPTFPNVMACQPVADLWASFDKETNLQVVSDKVENFFFTGLSGFLPVVHPDNYGDKSPDEDGGYGATRGQVRVGHKMQVPWEWREFHVKRTMGGSTPLTFAPASVKSNPIPERFDVEATPGEQWFRDEFRINSTMPLAASALHEIRMQTPGKSHMGQSAFEGAAASDYATRGAKQPGSDFASQIDAELAAQGIGLSCPPDDRLDGKAILKRASMQTCAGCHAPQKFLEPGNSIGCGLTWPDSLGEVHIDENSQLSPALKDVFLPRRAEVLSAFAGGCGVAYMNTILTPADPGDMAIPK